MDGHDPRFAGDVSTVLIQMSDKTTARAFGMNSLDSIYNKGTDHLTFVKSNEDVVARLFAQFAGRIGFAVGSISSRGGGSSRGVG